MLSRKKQQAAENPTTPGSPADCGRRLTRATVSKLNRGPRCKAAAGTRKQLPEAVTHKTEEICTDKTPKRLHRSNQWTSTFSSPSNEEFQQEIFWDPHSPMPYKSDNEKRKRIGKSTVEISDIVNRIAPQDEKPASSEIALLGMWIGENAIPCTPGVGTVRPRSKLSCSKHKIKNTEDELMKLAKQFDQNLIDAIQENDHQEQGQILVGGEHLTDHGESGNTDSVYVLPNDTPEREITLSLNSIKPRSITPTSEQIQNSQKSVDQETEAAFNALFDSSTQKCSGTLSQGLSDSSQKSSQGNKYLTDIKEDIDLKTAGHIQQCANIANVEQHSATRFSVEEHIRIHEKKTSNIVQKEDAASTTNVNTCNTTISMSTDQDEFDDWGSDLLEDDSFLMQITQNPELVKTPQNKMSLSKLSRKSPRAVEGKDIVMHGCKTSPLPNANHFQFKPSQPFQGGNFANDRGASSANRLGYYKTDGSDLQNPNSYKSVGKCSYKSNTQSKPSTLTSKIVSKPIVPKTKERLQPLHIPIIDVTRTDCDSSLVKDQNPHNTITRNSSQGDVCLSLSKLSSSSSQKKSKNLEQSLSKQAVDSNLNPSTLQTKNSTFSDDWDDPKFSDEILDMFCNSDSLFEANEEEDDLLYQVCDDIERLTQSAANKPGNEKCESQIGNVIAKLDANKRLVVPNPAPGCNQMVQSKPLNQSTFSLAATSSKKNICGSYPVIAPSNINSTFRKAVASNLPSVRKCSISQNFGNKNDLGLEKFSRSHSTPAESFDSVSHAKMENNVKPQSSSSFNKTLAAQPPQKFSFTKLKTSQLTAGHIHRNGSQSETALCTETQHPFGEGKALTNVSLHGNLPGSLRHSLKRQLSESFLQSTKVLTAEERTQKCSQEEIERKKLEALERLKKRTQSRLKDT